MQRRYRDSHLSRSHQTMEISMACQQQNERRPGEPLKINTNQGVRRKLKAMTMKNGCGPLYHTILRDNMDLELLKSIFRATAGKIWFDNRDLMGIERQTMSI